MQNHLNRLPCLNSFVPRLDQIFVMGKRCCTGKLITAVTLFCSLCVLPACGEKPSIKLGYVGGVSGRTADLGTGGRNGIQLAVEQTNATGGINGHKIELLLKDDETNPEKGKQAVKELIAARVEAILGPMTSNVAQAVVPLTNEAGILMMAGSVSGNDLSGKDDQFFRAVAASSYHAAGMAKFLIEQRRIMSLNVVLELGNKAYTESWLAAFEKPYRAAGGRIVHVIRYTSAQGFDFSIPANATLEGSVDGIVLVTSAVDAALLINQLRQKQVAAQLITTEWAGTGKLIELGGASVEGVFVPQYFNRDSEAPAYKAFREAYRQRFNQEPGFPAVVGFNAAQVVITALRERRDKESLKQVLLRIRRFDGLQEPLVFDDFGDVRNMTYLTMVNDGRYVTAR
jgi:branched-chain amino acid transport system substrate-binding protein